jgi:hypothetical protein
VPCGCCLAATVGSVVPRLTLLFVWLFTDLVDRAFDGWLAPLAGLLLLPFSTLAYVFMWAPGRGVTGLGWFVVIAAFLIDISSYAGGAFGRGRSTTVSI